MLGARSVAVVGASATPHSFGHRLLSELGRSPSRPEIYPVNPRYGEIDGRACVPSLADLDGPVDLVALAVGDSSLEAQLIMAADRGDRSAVIFGSIVDVETSSPDGAPGGAEEVDDKAGGRVGLRERLAAIASEAGMALCGGGCMGFVNMVEGLRAIGYHEQDPLPAGPIALVTHSGSAFSALLRADRRLGWTLAVSSGQELVTTAASYLDYALSLEGTGVVALLLETLRQPEAFRASLERARSAGIPVVALTVGASASGRAMVAAHSGALAGSDAMWEALFEAHGVLRVGGLDEMADTLELLAAGRRVLPGPTVRRRRGIAAVHDSGAERALVVDVAQSVALPFAEISPATTERLGQLLDPGLDPVNPLDVWGRGASTRELFAGSLTALAGDEAVDAVALCVDFVPELDGDSSYAQALLDGWSATKKPVCLISNLSSSLDRQAARRLREAGIPVLEGTRSGLVALAHLLRAPEAAAAAVNDGTATAGGQPVDPDRRAHWRARLEKGSLSGAEGFLLLADYGIDTVACAGVGSAEEAVAAAESIGWPVALKTDNPSVSHKTDAGGVFLGLVTPAEVRRAYAEMSRRLGPQAVVTAMAPAGVEMALGVVQDPLVGPIVVVGAGGVLVEVLRDRAVALPPMDEVRAHHLLDRLSVAAVLSGVRGRPPADRRAIERAVVAVAHLALELGEVIEALDVNPLLCHETGAIALDCLVERRL